MRFPDLFPVLTTRRLVQRAVADHDIDAVFAMESDAVAMRYWSRPPMRELAEARESVERAKQYFLARDHWGQGFMREAPTTVIGFAFGPLDLRRLEADIDPRNLRSVSALERLGFAREGLLRERWQVGDEISDSVLMGLLARDWRAHPGD